MPKEKSLGVVDLTRAVAFQVTDNSLLTVDLEQVTKTSQEHIRAVDAANLKPKDQLAADRAERAELERRLKHAITESEAKKLASDAEHKHTDIIKGIEREIAHVTSLLNSNDCQKCKYAAQGIPQAPSHQGGGSNKWICSCDGCLFLKKIESLNHELTQAKVAAERSVRKHGATIKAAKELDKLRPRLKELKARFDPIDIARKVCKKLISGDGNDLKPERFQSNEEYGLSLEEKPFDLMTPHR